MATHSINASVCNTVFANVPLGDITDMKNHTIGCRMKYLTMAPYNSTANACRFAGPTGGGLCGAPLDAVCDIANATCTGQAANSYADVASCKSGLGGIGAQWGHSQGPASSGEDSLECRVYHAVASLTLGQVHCGHYNLTTIACNARVVPNPAYYCQTLQYNCNATGLTQFSMPAQCTAVSAAYPTSSTDSAVTTNAQTNTLGCRSYHAQAALSDTSHCAHAGPSGGQFCGTYAEAWASIVKAAPCNDTATYTFLAALGPNADAAVPVGSAPYSVNLPDTANNTQACRIYHLGVASTDPSHCDHTDLTGGDICGTTTGNLCDIIGGVCGWGTNATYQYANRAACLAGLNNTLAGTPGDSTGNTLACRYYHVGVAGSFKNGSIQGNATGAMDSLINHCSHVIAVPLAGCAAGSTAPTASMTSSASAVALMVPAALAVASFLM